MEYESQKTEYSARQEWEREKAITKANERIGNILSQVWQRLKGGIAPEDLEKVQKEIHVVFRPTSDPRTRVWVDAFYHSPDFRNEDTHLRSFQIRLVPPEAYPKYQWIVNQSVQGDGVQYAPAFLEYDEMRKDALEREGTIRPELHGLQDPTIQEMEKTAQLLEECWQLFTSGDTNAIYWWGGQA